MEGFGRSVTQMKRPASFASWHIAPPSCGGLGHPNQEVILLFLRGGHLQCLPSYPKSISTLPETILATKKEGCFVNNPFSFHGGTRLPHSDSQPLLRGPGLSHTELDLLDMKVPRTKSEGQQRWPKIGSEECQECHSPLKCQPPSIWESPVINLRSNSKFKLIKINIQSKATGLNYLLWQREFNGFKQACKKNLNDSNTKRRQSRKAKQGPQKSRRFSDFPLLSCFYLFLRIPASQLEISLKAITGAEAYLS